MWFDIASIASFFTKKWGLHIPSALFLGEIDFPQEEE